MVCLRWVGFQSPDQHLAHTRIDYKDFVVAYDLLEEFSIREARMTTIDKISIFGVAVSFPAFVIQNGYSAMQS